jgi:AGCS family alanine or glycine:cation symporter
MMILGMAFPNLIGVVLLSGKVKGDLDSYMRRLRAGEFTKYR